MELVILVGPPGSGKSTLATTLYKDHVRVSQDDQGKAGHMKVFEEALEAQQNIVVDRMNFDVGQRSRYAGPAVAEGYKLKYHVIFSPRDVCMDRMLMRKDHPTIKTREDAEAALNTFFRFFTYPKADGVLDELVQTYDIVEEFGRPVVICDLDGTLCNIDHRIHHVRHEDRKMRRWDRFFAGIPEDKLNADIAYLLLNMLDGNSSLDIVYASGRGEDTREATENWLYTHDMNIHKHLFMRPAKDSRDDALIKEIILDFEILTRYIPIFVLDDRTRVVNMWRKRGVRCLQVAPGDF